MTAMKDAVRRLARRPLAALRSRSNRMVFLVPETGVGFGNILYFLLAAHRARTAGTEAYITPTRALAPWLGVFPDLGELVLARGALRLTDQRMVGWHQNFGTSFTADELDAFVAGRLVTSPTLAARASFPDTHVTVNVRRGDYYSVPEFRARYGFDVAGFVRVAMAGVRAQGPVSRVRVVSDDPAWCAEHLAFLADDAALEFQDPADGPVDNLLDLARSPRLVLTNSTFSYWGAHISNGRFGDNHDRVWAPEFHSRQFLPWLSWQLDPRWSIVHDVPGGWAEP